MYHSLHLKRTFCLTCTRPIDAFYGLRPLEPCLFGRAWLQHYLAVDWDRSQGLAGLSTS